MTRRRPGLRLKASHLNKAERHSASGLNQLKEASASPTIALAIVWTCKRTRHRHLGKGIQVDYEREPQFICEKPIKSLFGTCEVLLSLLFLSTIEETFPSRYIALYTSCLLLPRYVS